MEVERSKLLILIDAINNIIVAGRPQAASNVFILNIQYMDINSLQLTYKINTSS
jgi:hypothetical protein